MEFGWEGVDYVEEVEGSDGFGDAPGVAAGEVQAGCDACFALGLHGGEGCPLDYCDLGDVSGGCGSVLMRFEGALEA